MIVYNADLPTLTYEDNTICRGTYTSRNYRLADIDLVYEREPGLRKLIDNAPLYHHHSRILIDVKVQALEPKQYTAVNKGWHLDGKGQTKNRGTADNIYHLILWGGAPTIFIKEPFGVGFVGVDQRLLATTLDLDCKTKYPVPDDIWHTYGEFHWHRCGRAYKECVRTFIRITETDYVKAKKII